MRVITGKARGVLLKTPDGMLTRPTTDRVKEALFSIIQFDIPTSRVLDLFGGTGQLGIEALSRGAKSAVFVDHQENACKLIRENLRRTRLEADGKVVRADYLDYLPKGAVARKIPVMLAMDDKAPEGKEPVFITPQEHGEYVRRTTELIYEMISCHGQEFVVSCQP